MNMSKFDVVAVVATVLFAAAWLAFHFRRNHRRRAESKGKIGACGAPCDGCPHSKDCGGKTS